MITESIYWRRDLFRSAAELRAKSRQRSWRDASYYRVEAAIIHGALAVRRLADSRKLPDDALSSRIVVAEVPSRDADPRWWHEHPADLLGAMEMYDFHRVRSATVDLEYLVNQFIHSHHLMVVRNRGTDPLVLFASDRARGTYLRGAWLTAIADVFEMTSLLEPLAVESRYEESKGRYITSVPAGRTSDRLVQWGFITADDYRRALARVANGQRGADLVVMLNRTHAELLKDSAGAADGLD